MLIGRGCTYRHEGSTLVVQDPGGQTVGRLTFTSSMAVRRCIWELSTLTANLEQDTGSEPARMSLEAENVG